MNRILKTFQNWLTPKTIKIENTETILPLSIDDTVEMVFLILPYIKILKKIKEEYKSNSPLDIFYEVTQGLLSQMNKFDLDRLLGIIFRVKPPHELRISDFLEILPRFIRVNQLYEVYLLLDNLGVFN